jgi:N6-adenosine-specific RNA methylase IME4
MNELVAIAQYAERICAAWRQSVTGVFEAGKLLAQAEAEFGDDLYKRLIAELPFTIRTAQRLKAIAQDERLAAHVSDLPPHWSTCYEITKLQSDQFDWALEAKIINPEMQRKDISQIIKSNTRAQREHELGQKQRALPDKKYGVIVADPPWSFKAYSKKTGMDRAPDNHYPTQDVSEITALDVPSISHKDCVLFLWATAPMLREALQVMAAWQFEYKSHYIWGKTRTQNNGGHAWTTRFQGTGYWNRNSHELLLIGTKGKIPAPAQGRQRCSLIDATIGEHSAKPEIFLEMIEGYYPTLPKIELNRRGPARKNWDAWGNEAKDNDERTRPSTIDSQRRPANESRLRNSNAARETPRT